MWYRQTEHAPGRHVSTRVDAVIYRWADEREGGKSNAAAWTVSACEGVLLVTHAEWSLRGYASLGTGQRFWTSEPWSAAPLPSSWNRVLPGAWRTIFYCWQITKRDLHLTAWPVAFIHAAFAAR